MRERERERAVFEQGKGQCGYTLKDYGNVCSKVRANHFCHFCISLIDRIPLPQGITRVKSLFDSVCRVPPLVTAVFGADCHLSWQHQFDLCPGVQALIKILGEYLRSMHFN